MIRHDFGEQSLNVIIASASDYWSDKFDFDSDFTTYIDMTFHCWNVPEVP